MPRVEGKIALITGGAGGIGAASARLLAREGARVVITDVVEKPGQALANQIGGRFHRHDVSDFSEWERVIGEIDREFGRLDIFLHCAGIEGSLKDGGLNTTLESWRKVMAINLDGTFYGAKTVMPLMMKHGTGSMILISSIVAYMATSSALAYGVSKAGVQQMARTLAVIGAKNGNRIRCNSLHPGFIRSRMTDNILLEVSSAAGVTPDEMEAEINKGIPFGRRGEAQDVANMILFLASDESSYITGAEFKVDGGWLIKDAG